MAITYFTLGLTHILDLNGYDHMLFVAMLVAGIEPRQWKPLLWMVTAFTLGHSLTLALGILDLSMLPPEWVEFFIPVTIAITAALNVSKSRKNSAKNYVLAVFFGLIHGMGFAGYLSALMPQNSSIWEPLLFFNLGVEVGQIIIASVVVGILLVIALITKRAVRIAQIGISTVGMGISLFLAIHNWPF